MASSGASETNATDALGKTPLLVVVDTNVVLDLVLAREPWATEAKPIWDALDHRRLIAYLAASALTDIYYVCRKQVGAERARQALVLCLQRFKILTIDRSLLETALALAGRDFEDDVQVAAAQTVNADLILSRDATGFDASRIPALDPAALVARLAGS